MGISDQFLKFFALECYKYVVLTYCYNTNLEYCSNKLLLSVEADVCLDIKSIVLF